MRAPIAPSLDVMHIHVASLAAHAAPPAIARHHGSAHCCWDAAALCGGWPLLSCMLPIALGLALRLLWLLGLLLGLRPL